MWHILGKATTNAGLMAVKPKQGLRPRPFAETSWYAFLGGGFIKRDEPKGIPMFCQMNGWIPEVVKAMRTCMGHSNVILTAGGGSFRHKDGPKPGAISCRQSEEAWKAWRSGQHGPISLSDGVIEFAKTHDEMKGAFLSFPERRGSDLPRLEGEARLRVPGACAAGVGCSPQAAPGANGSADARPPPREPRARRLARPGKTGPRS
ncbi:rbcG [Symbiodinium natans]|uniref:RbcG protein n=1 Tax=Symbiodinium natans TaxID=878477 RepID=A0A812UAG5_9DINO|nr:rbcG [Symbiodinium natans]